MFGFGVLLLLRIGKNDVGSCDNNNNSDIYFFLQSIDCLFCVSILQSPLPKSRHSKKTNHQRALDLFILAQLRLY